MINHDEIIKKKIKQSVTDRKSLSFFLRKKNNSDDIGYLSMADRNAG